MVEPQQSHMCYRAIVSTEFPAGRIQGITSLYVLRSPLCRLLFTKPFFTR